MSILRCFSYPDSKNGVLEYLHNVLKSERVLSSVRHKLPYMDISEDEPSCGMFGVNYGVAKAVIQLENVQKEQGMQEVESFLSNLKK